MLIFSRHEEDAVFLFIFVFVFVRHTGRRQDKEKEINAQNYEVRNQSCEGSFR